MSFHKSAYAKLENVVAILVCIASPVLFGVLWYLGFMPLGDFYLSVIISVGITLLNVSITWLVVRFSGKRRKKKRKG